MSAHLELQHAVAPHGASVPGHVGPVEPPRHVPGTLSEHVSHHALPIGSQLQRVRATEVAGPQGGEGLLNLGAGDAADLDRYEVA